MHDLPPRAKGRDPCSFTQRVCAAPQRGQRPRGAGLSGACGPDPGRGGQGSRDWGVSSHVSHPCKDPAPPPGTGEGGEAAPRCHMSLLHKPHAWGGCCGARIMAEASRLGESQLRRLGSNTAWCGGATCAHVNAHPQAWTHLGTPLPVFAHVSPMHVHTPRAYTPVCKAPSTGGAAAVGLLPPPPALPPCSSPPCTRKCWRPLPLHKHSCTPCTCPAPATDTSALPAGPTVSRAVGGGLQPSVGRAGLGVSAGLELGGRGRGFLCNFSFLASGVSCREPPGAGERCMSPLSPPSPLPLEMPPQSVVRTDPTSGLPHPIPTGAGRGRGCMALYGPPAAAGAPCSLMPPCQVPPDQSCLVTMQHPPPRPNPPAQRCPHPGPLPGPGQGPCPLQLGPGTVPPTHMLPPTPMQPRGA